ncbi:GGDEF domain-containing protein [Roseateles violae]|uniref:diguanylate cyclase n=1 Tax=Roseateles violae TaxID=3058042 RepID=A0ABT8DPW3_9BURK|nr:GGDEF domain-containing protein [Pelomonas sp. PFR6]MDN3920182.1 GGDEF domain-containing protein [Pelomonas sp. PFR6]
MDLRTLFIAQTCALIAIAAMLWIARAPDDRRNGLRTWTLAVSSQGIAYLLLANAGRLPVLLSALLGNAAGALSVALFYVAIRQFLGLRYRWPWLLAMVAAVTIAGGIAGSNYAGATIFNGFVYGAVQLLNGAALWRRPAAGLQRVQRLVALAYLAMGLVLPLRALAMLLQGSGLAYLDMPPDWQQPIYVFGFLFIIVTNLGFMQLCKMRAEAEVRLQAMTDGLTGLANRRALDEAMHRSLAGAQRDQQPFAVLMLDIDHFKAINDRFGHHQGDATLAAFAARLRAGLRAQDQCFRYGGEEFCVLLPQTGAADAALLAERLRAHLVLPASGEMPRLSASLGIAVWQAGDSADALFGRADRALYRAKTLGRDRVEIDQ